MKKIKCGSSLGFTLIELLAVIFLLLIILMISTPNIKRMIDDANILSETSLKERLIDAAKEYTTLYNKNLLNGLVVVGDKKNISVNNLVNVGLIKKDDISSLKSNAFVVIELKENSELEYKLEYNDNLIEDNTLFIALLGKTTYYLLKGIPFIDPGYIAFDSNGNNITNKVIVSGNNFDVNVIGTHVVTYTVTDNDKTVSVTRNVIVIDPTYPEVISAVVTSNNEYNNKRAKNGDTITLSLIFSKDVTDPTVTIGGREAIVTGSGSTRTATYTIPAGEVLLLEEKLNIRVENYRDEYSNIGIVATEPTTGGLVTYDRTAPSVTVTSIVSNHSNNKYAKNGHMLTLNITFSEVVVNPTVTIAGRTATVTGSGNTRTATYTIPTGESSITEGNVAISIIGYRDETGNFGNTFTNITTGGNVVYDRTPPSCTSSGGNTAWTNGNRTITATCSDSGGSGCTTATKTYTYSSNTNTTTAGPDGSNDYRFTDNAGNQSAVCPKNQTVKIDKTPPTCSITLNGANVQLTGTDTLSGLASSPYSWNNSTWGTTNTQTAGTAAFTVTGYVKDAASNVSSCSFSCSNYSDSVSYVSSCTKSGSAGNGTTYTTCSVNNYKCSCKCTLSSGGSYSWSAVSNNCQTKCNQTQEPTCMGTTGSASSVNQYKKTVYTRTCN